MANTNTTSAVGRPRIAIKLPRKEKFTTQDVIELNVDVCSALTVRNNLTRLVELAELVIAGTQKLTGRGRPRFLYSRKSS
jgi:predicted ArsR family transcriptional regulator